MNATDSLLRLADTYATAYGLPLTTVSWRIFGDTKKLAAVRNGADLQTRRLEKAVCWFSENWPADVEWPCEIRRPVAVKVPEFSGGEAATS